MVFRIKVGIVSKFFNVKKIKKGKGYSCLNYYGVFVGCEFNI